MIVKINRIVQNANQVNNIIQQNVNIGIQPNINNQINELIKSINSVVASDKASQGNANQSYNHNINFNINYQNIECSDYQSSSDSDDEDHYKRYEPFLQSKTNANFNFPEIDEPIGNGFKKMKAYISPISKEELEKKRNDFWTSRIEGDHTIWATLKLCCETEDMQNIKAFLKAAGIRPFNRCLNICFDSHGQIYEVPNYCINPPIIYDANAQDVKRPEKEVLLNLKLRYLTREFRMEISNYTKVMRVIENLVKVLKEEDKTIEADNVKLFYCGRELKRDEDLWTHKINEENIVTIFVNKFKD